MTVGAKAGLVVALIATSCVGQGNSASQVDGDLGSWCSAVASLSDVSLDAADRVTTLDRFATEAPPRIRNEARVVAAHAIDVFVGIDPSDHDAIAEATRLTEENSEVSSAATTVEQFIETNCPPPQDCDPRVDLTLFPQEIRAGESVTVTMSAHAEYGIEVAWWSAESSDRDRRLLREELRPSGAPTVANEMWTVALEGVGTYTFSANVRDITYGDYTQDPQRPRQASEGCGIAEVTVVVR